MKINRTITIAVVLFGLLVGGLGAGVFLTQQPSVVDAAPPPQADTACVDDDDVQHEAEGEVDEANEASDCEENEVDETNETSGTGEVNEADETEEVISPDQANISANEAKAAAEAAQSGAKVLTVELENEDGKITYEVELDNGMEVLIDATNGEVLSSDVE